MKWTHRYTFPLVLKTLLLGAIACGTASGPADADLARHTGQSTTQFAHARSICESVIRLQTADALFKECTSSLKEFLQTASQADAVSQARDACFASTPKLDNTNLSLCLSSAAEAKDGADDIQPLSNIPASRQMERESTVSFYAASRATNLGREQRACALVGFDPAFGAFAKCVSSLQDSLDDRAVTGGE
jgi:hypothetical protein